MEANIFSPAWGTGIRKDGMSTALMRLGDVVLSLGEINEWAGADFPLDLESLIRSGVTEDIEQMVQEKNWFSTRGRPREAWRLSAALTRPDRILGIGLNFRDHAQALGERVPEAPATFLKPLNTIARNGDAIALPKTSTRVTAEAEIALIFGESGKNIDKNHFAPAIWGALAVLDFTAEDVLRQNPRFLTRAKGYDGFFALSDWAVPWRGEAPFHRRRTIDLIVNDMKEMTGSTEFMSYSFGELVAWISEESSISATTLLSTGTPGAKVIEAGDRVRAHVEGLYDVEVTIK